MKNAGLWFGVLLLIVSAALFKQAWSYSYYSKIGPGPGLFPVWLSGLLFFFAALYAIDTLRHGSISVNDILPRGAGLKKVLVLIGALILFIVSAPYLGYLAASVVLAVALFSLDYPWSRSIPIALAVSFAVYYVFKNILSVPLPKGLFGF